MAFSQESLTPPASEHTLVKRAALLTGAAITLSAATIITYNTTLANINIDSLSSGAQLVALSLFPYMLSAVIAAITAIAVMGMLPSAQLAAPTELVRGRLQAMASGDLSSRLAVKPKSPLMQALVADLNLATSSIGHDITTWKMINRQQWELLEAMREITVVGGQAQLIKIIEQMERNWEKIAEVEARLTT